MGMCVFQVRTDGGWVLRLLLRGLKPSRLDEGPVVQIGAVGGS